MENPNSAMNPKSATKRKREIEEIPKIDSDGCNVAKRKASRQVSEFEDTYGLYNFFCQKLIFEREDFDPLKHYMDFVDDERDEKELLEDMKNAPYDRHAVLKYIKQIRQSFGFDLNVNLPMWLTGLRYFTPLDLSDGTYDRAYAYRKANFAIIEINADMNRKTYELVEVVKCVWTISYYSLVYLTLIAKKVGVVEDADVTIQAIVKYPITGPMELQQWRIKPDAPPPAEEAPTTI